MDNFEECGRHADSYDRSEFITDLAQEIVLEVLSREMAPKLSKTRCSFVPGTKVLMADGTCKPIEELQAGDTVLAADPEIGEKGARAVTAVMMHQDTVIDLVMEEGSAVTTTEDHPFWNETDRAWQRADQLDTGGSLLTAAGDNVRVSGLRAGSEHVTAAYNLTVNDLRTYYVAYGDNTVLVHNTCPEDGTAASSPDPKVRSAAESPISAR
jgi:hypothetical protein